MNVPDQRMTKEQFEQVLVEVRNGANTGLVERVLDGSRDAHVEDARAVWHASEVALGILKPGYVPKREALVDVRRLLAWIDDEDDAWLDTQG